MSYRLSISGASEVQYHSKKIRHFNLKPDKYFEGAFVAIAGNFGFAHYSVASKKWKLFGNIMQERDMVVTGGLTWWEDFICVACYNLQESRDEIRLYPRRTVDFYMYFSNKSSLKFYK